MSNQLYFLASAPLSDPHILLGSTVNSSLTNTVVLPHLASGNLSIGDLNHG